MSFPPRETTFPISIQVLQRSVADPDIGNLISTVGTLCFLEDLWLLALSPVGRIIVFNTLLSQQDPGCWRVFDLPPPLHPQRSYSIHTQYEKLRAEFPEFSVDPTQRIIVAFSIPDLAFVLPSGLLIRHMSSVRISPHVLWNEWDGDTIALRLRPNMLRLQIFDTKVLGLCLESLTQGQWGVEMFDLSVSGRREVREGPGGGASRVLPRSKWFALCPESDQSYNPVLAGNNLCFAAVSPLYMFNKALLY